jgi:hypothetical protein
VLRVARSGNVVCERAWREGSRLAKMPGEVRSASQPDRGDRRGDLLRRCFGDAGHCRTLGEPSRARERRGRRCRSRPRGAHAAPVAVRGQHLPRRARLPSPAGGPATASAIHGAGLRRVEPRGDRGRRLARDRRDPLLAGVGGGHRRGGWGGPGRLLGRRRGRRAGGSGIQARPDRGGRGPGRGRHGRGQAQRAVPHHRARPHRRARLRRAQHRRSRPGRVRAASARPRPGRLRDRHGRHHLVHVLRHRPGRRQRDGRHRWGRAG